jgi:hypothetical protein
MGPTSGVTQLKVGEVSIVRSRSAVPQGTSRDPAACGQAGELVAEFGWFQDLHAGAEPDHATALLTDSIAI